MTASPPSGSPPSPALNGSRRRGNPAAGLAEFSDAKTHPPAALDSAETPPTREAVLALLLRHGEATAADLAERLSVSVQAMRRHLRGLPLELGGGSSLPSLG
jgi:DeoR family suf operon transcriptional repressor